MSRDITWNDTDPATGEKRYVSAEKFARRWQFKVKHHRREEWRRTTEITPAMWAELLDACERRYQRREGVTDEDLVYLRAIVAKHAEPGESAPGSP